MSDLVEIQPGGVGAKSLSDIPEYVSLRSKLEKAREALRPFAVEPSLGDLDDQKYNIVSFDYDGHTTLGGLTAGDLRRARSVLAELEDNGEAK